MIWNQNYSIMEKIVKKESVLMPIHQLAPAKNQFFNSCNERLMFRIPFFVFLQNIKP